MHLPSHSYNAFAVRTTNFQKSVFKRHGKSSDHRDACHTAEQQKDKKIADIKLRGLSVTVLNVQTNVVFLLANFKFPENFLEIANRGEKKTSKNWL